VAVYPVGCEQEAAASAALDIVDRRVVGGEKQDEILLTLEMQQQNGGSS
jgi:hypothetical protein